MDNVYDWIKAYCLDKKGVESAYKAEWNMTLFRVGGRIFAELGSYKDGRALLTLKLEPAFSELLRAQYPEAIIPGYYCNKVHWSSLFLDGGVPDDVARAMMDNAYQTVFTALPRKVRAQIEAQ